MYKQIIFEIWIPLIYLDWKSMWILVRKKLIYALHLTNMRLVFNNDHAGKSEYPRQKGFFENRYTNIEIVSNASTMVNNITNWPLTLYIQATCVLSHCPTILIYRYLLFINLISVKGPIWSISKHYRWLPGIVLWHFKWRHNIFATLIEDGCNGQFQSLWVLSPSSTAWVWFERFLSKHIGMHRIPPIQHHRLEACCHRNRFQIAWNLHTSLTIVKFRHVTTLYTNHFLIFQPLIVFWICNVSYITTPHHEFSERRISSGH